MYAVSYEQCVADLVVRGGAPAQAALAEWKARPDHAEVVRFVTSFEHKALFALSTEEVHRVLMETDHALGDVQPTEQMKFVEDFYCPFALQHLFHNFIERTGELPTWQRFWRWMNRQAEDKWLIPIRQRAERDHVDVAPRAFDRAVRWRLGKFYYSAVREVDLIVSLRALGVDLRYHLLADVLLRADFWHGDDVVCTYFPNERYRSEQAGRKPPAERFLGNADPPLRIMHLPIERQGFGRTWLASERAKRAVAEAMVSSTQK